MMQGAITTNSLHISLTLPRELNARCVKSNYKSTFSDQMLNVLYETPVMLKQSWKQSFTKHYNKALILLLTSFYHLQITGHPLYHVLSNHLNAFDEYPVENFHSIEAKQIPRTLESKFFERQEKLMPVKTIFKKSNHGLF